MKRSYSIYVLLLCGLLMLSLCSVLLCSCDGRHHVEGVTWQAPDDKVMPLAFRDNEDMPAYAKRWRMPEGFLGFPARWNEKVKAYLERSIETKTEELKRSMSQHLSAVPGSPEHRRAGVRAQSDRISLANLMERSRMGDYLVFRRPKDLPDHLVWQDGADEPELGSPEARKGGTLRLPLQRSFPNTLRPFGPNSNNATRRYVYDDIDLPLVRIHPGTGHLIPGTADRWAVSPDNRTVYFHIDPKASFSNGRRLTSRDYICSLFVRTSTFAEEPFYGSYYMGNFARITVYGDEYLAVTLNAPRPYAPVYASIPACCTSFYAEFGPDYTTRYLWRVAPTTGAYTILPDGLNMGRSMVLSRVKDWWAADRKFTRYSCNVDNIVYLFVTETSKVRELFRIGRLDVFSARDADVWYEGMEIDPVYRGLIQRVRFNNIWPRNCFGWHLNVSKPPFNNRDVRLGFHHALNVQSVINTVFRGDYSRLGSYFSGFGKYTDTGIRALPFSPEKARRYFARAGYTEEDDDGILCKPDGTRLQVVVSSRIDSLYANCMNMLREDAAKCGLDLRLEQMDDTVFYLKVKEKKHSAAIFSWGFSPPLPDASAFFLSEYAVKEDGTPLPGTNNITATASPELDGAILDCRMATTEQEMVEAQYRVQRLIADTAAWVPGWTTSYWRFAQWRWLRWPDTPECRFCPPRYYDPLDSHLYWIDEDIKRETLEARTGGGSFPESQIDVPLPEAQATPPEPQS